MGEYFALYWQVGDEPQEKVEFLVCSEEDAVAAYAEKLLKVPNLKKIRLEETDFYGEPYWTVESHTIID